ncbi:hypothetical protein [Microbacterium sp. ZW T5_56]|uniref:hypothetical protein n=1 Tax=Microbacterium sp. ZW T5_56 TaxID=3378081 RepID=UPI003852099B
MFATPAVETWISPSGRVGTVALDQDPVALEALRDMMRAQGYTLQNEEAGEAAGTAVSGEIINPGQGTIDTSVTPDVDERDLTIVQRTTDVTPEEVDWAAGNLAHLSTTYHDVKTDRQAVDVRSGGRLWRSACRIVMLTDDNGVEQFRVVLYKGATIADVTDADEVIEQAKAGYFLRHGWDRIEDFNGSPRYLFAEYRRVDGRTSEPALVCDEPQCSEGWHSVIEDHCAEEMLSRTTGARYEIRVRRPVAEAAAPWQVEVYADDFMGTPEQVAAFMNDLSWCQQACVAANAKRTKVVAA